MKIEQQPWEKKLVESFAMIYNLQRELDKGVLYTMKIYGVKLSVKLHGLCVEEDDDEIFLYDDDYQIFPNCELSKFLEKVASDSLYENYDSTDFAEKLSKMLFTKSLLALNKELKRNAESHKELKNISEIIRIFWASFSRRLDLDKNTKRFLDAYKKHLKNIEDKKKERANSVFLRGYWIPRSEIEKALKSKPDNEHI